MASPNRPLAVSYTHLDVYKRQVQQIKLVATTALLPPLHAHGAVEPLIATRQAAP